MKTVAIAITTFGNPGRLSALLDNMKWAGIPDVPVYVFEDPSWDERFRELTTEQYRAVCRNKGNLPLYTAPAWGCMQGIIEFAMKATLEDWIIYVPDDVLFTRGGLWNEYAGVLTYGREFVGAIQAPYWNAHDLVGMGILPFKEKMYQGWSTDSVPRNPHWDYPGVPRAYINVNGAGFSISRAQWKAMGGFPACTWRLDEWLGYQTWKCGRVCVTLPGPARVHYFGGATGNMPATHFHTVEAWQQATGGLDPSQTGIATQAIMDKLPDGTWDSILSFFKEGKVTL